MILKQRVKIVSYEIFKHCGGGGGAMSQYLSFSQNVCVCVTKSVG